MNGFDAHDQPGSATQYAVRYDEYGEAAVPFYTTISWEKGLVESIARSENLADGIRCTVVERDVTCSDWRLHGEVGPTDRQEGEEQ